MGTPIDSGENSRFRVNPRRRNNIEFLKTGYSDSFWVKSCVASLKSREYLGDGW